MTLEQFNIDLAERLKKKFKVEAVKLDFTHAVLINAMVENFFRRYPTEAARQEIYEAMKQKIDKNGAVELSPLSEQTEMAASDR